MFSFFVPVSKVQKDRRIIRETDMRMAKYSRRGLIVNFIAFLICLYGGQFLDQNRELTIVLTIGLLLVTFLRGVFLFRFDQIYPRAPGKWRTRYFYATLLGAFWWSVIMVSITVVLEMQHEAPLFWLYTVVFFSTTAHAFAPYHKFLSVYQFIGQIPAAIAAVLLGTEQGYLYGGLLMVFYLVLNHQCRLMSENYWERLEVSYALSRKTVSLEEEKKDTRASARLNLDFLEYLVADFGKMLENSPGKQLDEQNALYKSIKRFKRILGKELKLKNRVFNIRHEIQSIVADYVDTAEKKGIKIEASLSPTLPMRLRGDPKRLGGIVQNLVEMNLDGMQSGLLLIEAEFVREYETAGELYISVSTHCDKQRSLFFLEKNVVDTPSEENLAFAVSQALAELMEGSIERIDIPRQGVCYRFNARLDIADVSGQLDFHRNAYSGRTVLLVNTHAVIVDLKRQALEALGFAVITETQYERALSLVAGNAKLERPIEAVIYYFEGEGEEALAFHKSLKENKELGSIKEVLAVSAAQKIKLLQQLKPITFPLFTVNKPVGLFELESTFHRVWAERGGESEQLEFIHFPNVCRVHVLAESETHSEALAQLKDHPQLVFARFSNAEDLLNAMEEKPDVILLDVSDRDAAREVVNELRKFELKASPETLTPILGYTDEAQETCSFYDLGIDDRVELSASSEELISLLHYWGTLH